MATTQARTDTETLKVLEGVRPVYERLRNEKIRTDAEIERCVSDHEAAKAAAIAAFGTDDEGEIRSKIEERRVANGTRVDDFVARVRQIESDLADLARQPA